MCANKFGGWLITCCKLMVRVKKITTLFLKIYVISSKKKCEKAKKKMIYKLFNKYVFDRRQSLPSLIFIYLMIKCTPSYRQDRYEKKKYFRAKSCNRINLHIMSLWRIFNSHCTYSFRSYNWLEISHFSRRNNTRGTACASLSYYIHQ